ncbi:MAG: murein biosynthesis integral membrane protein MurJ [Rhodospirillales bacterium]
MTLARAVALVGGFTMLSRIAGFLRDMVTAAVLGSGPIADAFFIAFRLPNLFRRLFAEGSFNLAFVPLFAKELQEHDRAAARLFAEQAQAALLALLIPFSAILMVLMPYVVLMLAPGLHDDKVVLGYATEFGRITFPYLLFISLVSLQGGVLNTLDRFGHVAVTPILLNLTMIAAGLLLTAYLPNAGYALSCGVLAAGVIQYIWLAMVCSREGIRLRLIWPRWNPAIKRLALLTLPAAIGGGVQQINSMLDTIWASFLPAGSISYLYYADRINQLPLGVVGITIGTALLPMLSRQLRSGNAADAMTSQNRAMEIGLLFGLPAAIGIGLLAEPIMRVLFQRGAFDAAATIGTAGALAAYSIGLPAYVLVKTLAPGFYARHDTRTPLYIALVAIVANIAFNLALIWSLKHVGIALASALSGWLNFTLMAVILHRRGHFRIDAQFKRRAPRLIMAAIVMGGALYGGSYLLDALLHSGGVTAIAALAALVIGGFIVYGIAVLLLGGMKLGDLRRAMTRQPAATGEMPPQDLTDVG